MPDFVDYHKRSVTLPPGCKDLTDLFDLPPPPNKRASRFRAKFPYLEVNCEESGSVTSDEIEPLLRRAYECQMFSCWLTLSAPDDETVEWSLTRMRLHSEDAFRDSTGVGRTSAERMEAAKRIFAAHGLDPRPVEVFSLIWPEKPPELSGYSSDVVPPSAAACAKLVRDLFHEFVPGSKDAPLNFTYRELKTKA